MTMQQLFFWGSAVLKEAGVPEPELDARYLLLHVWSISFASFLASRNAPLPDNQEEAEKRKQYETLISKRAGRIPLQYLTGTQEFMGLEFLVNEHVLVPRQDTETLVELVLAEQKDREKALLDVCTGSGCIAISLAFLGGYRAVTALDISAEALRVAAQNAQKLLTGHGGTFSLLESNMFEGIEKRERFDIIVSNPPYIPTAVIGGLEPEVRDFEPRLALDGREDGLEFYRILAEQGREFLVPGGYIYMEIGCEQAEDVTTLFRGQGYESLKTVKDMAGLDRVVRAVWPGQEMEKREEGENDV